MSWQKIWAVRAVTPFTSLADRAAAQRLADYAIKYQKEKYPDMFEVTSRLPVAESIDKSYATTLDLMKTYPDLKGVIGFGSLGPIGAGQAVQKKRAKDKLAVVGIAMRRRLHLI